MHPCNWTGVKPRSTLGSAHITRVGRPACTTSLAAEMDSEVGPGASPEEMSVDVTGWAPDQATPEESTELELFSFKNK